MDFGHRGSPPGEPRLGRRQVAALGFECDVVEVFRPVAESARLVEIGGFEFESFRPSRCEETSSVQRDRA